MKRRITALVTALAVSCASQQQAPATTPVAAAPPANHEQPADASRGAYVGSVNMGMAGRLDVAVTSFGAAATTDHLYTLGGYSGMPHHYVKEHQSDRFARLDLKTGGWEALPSPGQVQSATLDEHGGRVYRVGGMRIDNAEGAPPQLTSVDRFEVFDPATNAWTALTPLPEPRSSHEAAFIGSKLYVVGGWKLAGGMDSGTWHDSMLVADVAETPIAWKRVATPFKARALGVAALGEQLYTVGGLIGHASRPTVNVYDPLDGTWREGPAFPDKGFGVTAAELDGRLYASGGSGTVYRLSLDGRSWEPAAQLRFGRIFHQLVAAGDQRLLFIGGIPGMGRDDRIVHIESLSHGGKPEALVSWTLDSPSPAKNRQGMFLHGNQLYSFGGNNSLGQHDFAEQNFIADAYRLDLGSLSWTRLPDFPRRRQSMQTLITNGDRGIAVGGFGKEGQSLTTRAELFTYDFEKEAWELRANGLPQARTQFGLTEHGKRLWIFGGLDFDASKQGREQFAHPLSVLSADLTRLDAGFSDSGVSLPRPRRAYSGARLGDKYYLVGGMAAGFELVDPCDVYDFSTRSWSTFTCPSRTRIGAELVPLDGKLYLIAGRSKPTPEADLAADDSIEVFDPNTGAWSPVLDDLPITDTHQLRAFAFGRQLLLFTSQREDGKVQLVLVDPATVERDATASGGQTDPNVSPTATKSDDHQP